MEELKEHEDPDYMHLDQIFAQPEKNRFAMLAGEEDEEEEQDERDYDEEDPGYE